MQLFYEILPVFLFFIAFKAFNIYVATVVGIIATLVQVLFNRVWFKNWDKKQVITLAVFVIFGGLTLYFHNPIFVKWKPTIVFWIFALAILITQFFTSKPLTQRLMENALQDKGNVPLKVWRQLNLVWCLFFIVLGGVNLYVAYCFSIEVWVNFKFYGVTGALFVFSLLQALYITRFISEEKAK